MDTVFLDANILFSAAYQRHSSLRRLWALPNVELVTSGYAAEEARRNLTTHDQLADLDELLRKVRIAATIPADHPRPESVKLPEKDRPILLSAMALKSSHLLTGDFKHFGRYYGQTVKGVPIQTPADYLKKRKVLYGQ